MSFRTAAGPASTSASRWAWSRDSMPFTSTRKVWSGSIMGPEEVLRAELELFEVLLDDIGRTQAFGSLPSISSIDV